MATNSISSVTFVVYGFKVETSFPFTVQLTKTYSSLGVAVRVTCPFCPNCVLLAVAVPPSPAITVTLWGMKLAIYSTSFVTVTVYVADVDTSSPFTVQLTNL